MEYWRVWAPEEEEFLWGVVDAGTVTMKDRHGGPSHRGVAQRTITSTVEEALRQGFGSNIELGKSEQAPGECRPRIWRKYYAPRPGVLYPREWTLSVQAARNLFIDMRDVFRSVEPAAGSNSLAYGHRIRELLILACTEVESAWKAVLLANSYPPGRWNTNDYVKLLGHMRLDGWELSLSMHTLFPAFKPFAGWNAADPTESLAWYSTYNTVKHGRESAFQEATLEHLAHAMGAVFIMVSAQFGPTAVVDSGIDGVRFAADQQWADDFAILGEPTWGQGQFYVPHQVAPGWAPSPSAPRPAWVPKPLWP